MSRWAPSIRSISKVRRPPSFPASIFSMLTLCWTRFGWLVANRDFDLWKKDGWDSVSIGRIEEATVEGRGAEVGAVVCGEGESLPLSLACLDQGTVRELIVICMMTMTMFVGEYRFGNGLPLDGTHDHRPSAYRGTRPKETERVEWSP
jgi:hypothetical protein